MKKATKQSRKTKRRKDRQARVWQQAETMLNNWLKTPQGHRAEQLRNAALMTALGRQFGPR